MAAEHVKEPADRVLQPQNATAAAEKPKSLQPSGQELLKPISEGLTQ